MACVYDPESRCDDNQRLEGGACRCGPNAVTTSSGCVDCGENEEPRDGACACVQGYERLESGSTCTPKTSGLGQACDGQAASCQDPVFAHCQGAGLNGYCTSLGCTSSEECTDGYACDTSGPTSYCRRPPLGLGRSCSAATDCAGTEATYCEAFVSKQCMVEDCSTSPNDCFAGLECCDLSALGLDRTLCLPAGKCEQNGGTR